MFGSELRRTRMESGLTQQELADSLFTSRSNVSKWESDKLGLPSEILLKWCKITNSPDVLMNLYAAIEVTAPFAQLITGTITFLGGIL